MSGILLDTHVWVWMLEDSRRLRGRMRDIVEDPNQALFLSTVSVWELAIKAHNGRMNLPLRTPRDFAANLAVTDVTLVDVDLEDTCAAAALPRHHGDPFDRIIVAQARKLDVPVLTSDPWIAAYDVEVIST
ncbi:type II toxin-antitoxin system VapC family toxin [Microbacterium sp. X-17]|uniref:type II toxin-antitoxin system VapC family toxin n=1 Tax=Microbacterium sp. X-17 TaxID=3144404 RepID=UPI0031F58DBC